MRDFLKTAVLCTLGLWGGVLTGVVAGAGGAFAQDWGQGGQVAVGVGRLFTNDALGDGQDRWRTGSYVISHLRGDSGADTGGPLVEYRLRSDIIAPADLVVPAPGDRRYVGALSFGMHRHWSQGEAQLSLGADLIATGPQTGMGWFQNEVHEAFGLGTITATDTQIGNAVHGAVTFEARRELTLGGGVLRPFAEVIAGPEILARIGADAHFGPAARGDVFLRDVGTGQLYRGTQRVETPGLTFTLGGDVAYVGASRWLDGVEAKEMRTRLRAGAHWQGEKSHVFYGLTYLSPEFAAQDEGQILGSINLGLRF